MQEEFLYTTKLWFAVHENSLIVDRKLGWILVTPGRPWKQPWPIRPCSEWREARWVRERPELSLPPPR